MEQQDIRNFNISELKKSERSIFYDDFFIMADNFGININDVKDKSLLTYADPIKTDNTFCLLCTKGSIKVRVNYTEYTLKPKMVLVIMPGSLGQMIEYTDDLEVCMIGFKDNRYFSNIQPVMAMSLYQNIINSAMVELDDNAVNLFLCTYKLMQQDFMDQNFEYKHDALTGYIQVLIAHAYQWIITSKTGTEQSGRAQQIYMQFVNFVCQYHSTERSVNFYADKMCLTPKYLSQVILKASGKYALDIIKDQVIFEAKALLKSNKYTVQEVSDKLNFPNPSFFGKYFKGEVGCSPRQYMKEG